MKRTFAFNVSDMEIDIQGIDVEAPADEVCLMLDNVYMKELEHAIEKWTAAYFKRAGKPCTDVFCLISDYESWEAKEECQTTKN